MDEKSGSLKMLRTHIGNKLKSLHFHFSDPRSHWVHRKSQYYQEGVRCCLMSFLLKVLSDMLQNPQLLSHIHICPKPEVKLCPTEISYPAPPSSLDIATARNPNQFDLTDGISVSLRWACKLSIACCNYFGLTKIWSRSHQFAWPTLCLLITKIGLTKFV